MTMKRILHGTLMFMVLVMSACGSSSEEPPSTRSADPSPTPREKSEINFRTVANDLQKTLNQSNSTSRTGQSPIVKPVKAAIDDAIRKLGTNENGLRESCVDCTDNAKEEALKVLGVLIDVKRKLVPVPDSKKVSDLDEDLKQNLQDLSLKAGTLKELSTAEAKPTEAPSVDPTVTRASTNGETGDPWWWDTLILSLKIIAGLLAVVLLVSAVSYLWKRAWKRLEINVGRMVKAHVAAERDGQPDYTGKFSSLSSTQAEMNTRLTELDTEVRSLARYVRESLARRPERTPSYSGSNHQSPVDDVSLKDEPEFPVSAVDYLGKMNRFATVVRPDFQNGILVNDPDGTGELVLIRDSRLSDATQPLFVVPSLTQFHTKQDFYTYYQKYYECVRPSAGDVWILGPAVVEKVTGGWQLREKGMLEIR